MTSASMQVIPSTAPAALTRFEHAVDQLEVAVASPTVVQRLLPLLADPDTSWVKVSELLSVDGGLVTRVLRMASSPAFAARPVRDLRFAMQALGSDQLRRIAVAANFAGRGSPFTQELWTYALRIAFSCDRLARAGHAGPGPDPFLCGLLHDVGTMALESIIGPSYVQLGFAPGGDDQVAIERARFGFDHADLGAMIAARWNLFPELELVTQLHHDVDACDVLDVPIATRQAIERVALARVLGRGPGDPSRAERDALCKRLGLEPTVAEACGAAAATAAAELAKSVR